jgi:hypothetical protein
MYSEGKPVTIMKKATSFYDAVKRIDKYTFAEGSNQKLP